MHHFTKLPSVQGCAYILQSQFSLRSFTLPGDALLSRLLCDICYSNCHSHWCALSKSPLWKKRLSHSEFLDKQTLKKIQLHFRQDNLCQSHSSRNSTLLSQCRPVISLDPILWLPMNRIKQNICLCWRLGWLPGGTFRLCPLHISQILSPILFIILICTVSYNYLK